MEEDILKYLPTVMFRGTPCIYLFSIKKVLQIILSLLSLNRTANSLYKNYFYVNRQIYLRMPLAFVAKELRSTHQYFLVHICLQSLLSFLLFGLQAINLFFICLFINLLISTCLFLYSFSFISCTYISHYTLDRMRVNSIRHYWYIFLEPHLFMQFEPSD